MRFVYPPRALPGIADAWGRTVETRIELGEKSEQQLQQTVNNGLRAQGGQLAVIADQVESLASAQQALAVQASEIQSTVVRLADVGNVQESGTGGDFNGTGWYPTPPSVTLSSLSGRFEVSVFGTSTGAASYYSFSAPGYPRTRIEGTSTTARTSRVSGAGGAASEFTVFGSWVVTPSTPAGENVTFTAQALGTTQYSSTVALRIQVRPAL